MCHMNVLNMNSFLVYSPTENNSRTQYIPVCQKVLFVDAEYVYRWTRQQMCSGTGEMCKQSMLFI